MFTSFLSLVKNVLDQFNTLPLNLNNHIVIGILIVIAFACLTKIASSVGKAFIYVVLIAALILFIPNISNIVEELPIHEVLPSTDREIDAETDDENDDPVENIDFPFLLGSSCVEINYDGNAGYNAELACSYNYGVCIAKDDIYSAITVLGEGGPNEGFLEAYGLLADGSMVPMYGAGICPVTTAIYQAARDAGLTILEANDHVGAESAYASRGDQAMFNYPDSDLKIKNSTPYDTSLYCGYHDGKVYAEWYAESL